jgi:hypothetical protein
VLLSPAQAAALVGRRVKVNYNLNTGNLTIRRDGMLVCGDVETLLLADVGVWYVASAHKQMRERGTRTVHIGFVGTVVEVNAAAPKAAASWTPITYNPWRAPEFHVVGDPNDHVCAAARVYLTSRTPTYTPPSAEKPQPCGFALRAPWHGQRATTRENVIERFRSTAARVWRLNKAQEIQDRIRLVPEPPRDNALAAVGWARWARPRTYPGLDLITAGPSEYSLYVSPRLLDADDATLDAVLVHEACHLGYPTHDERFRRLCLEHGGALTHNALTRGPRVQVKQGRHYVDWKQWPQDTTPAEARAQFLALRAQGPSVVPPGQYRLVY